MTKIRILHCTHSIDCGGLQRQLSYLAPEQAKRGYEVHVAYFRGNFFAERLQNAGVVSHHIKNIGDLHPRIPLRFCLYDPIVPLQLYRLIGRLKPDLIQTWFREMDIPAGFFAYKKNIPWIIREPNSYRKWPDTFSNILRKYIGKKASAVVSNSLSGDKYWEMSGSTNKRYVIRNAIPTDEISNYDNHLPPIGIRSDENFIMYAGRITRKVKNIFNLLEALVKTVTDRQIKAIVCGDGPHKNRIKRIVKKLCIAKKILLPGFLSDQDLWTLMKNAKAFVFVSNVEGCPNAVLEAMACRCPLVVSDIPEHREFLDESMAWFVDPNSPDDIASGIQKVLDNPKEARKKAVLAQRKVRNWQSIAKMAEEYEKVYYAVLIRLRGIPRS